MLGPFAAIGIGFFLLGGPPRAQSLEASACGELASAMLVSLHMSMR